MENQPKQKKEEYAPLKINLEKEEALTLEKGKKVVAKDPKGEVQYLRNDVIGLMGLLNRLDSKRHTIKELKQWTKVRDKIRDCFLDDKDVLELSLDQAAFLKDFLKSLPETEGKEQSLGEHEIRTLIGITDQFENQ